MLVRKTSLYTLLLMLLMVPLSVDFQGSAVNANYSLAFLPLFAVAYQMHREGALFLLIIALGSGYATNFIFWGDESAMLRQSASAILLALPVLLLFCRFPFGQHEIESAVVGVSVLYSLWVFLMVYSANYSLADIYIIKNHLDVPHWPQRFVVVLLAGYFMAIGRARERAFYFVYVGVILACVFLTFTRAAWLAISVGTVALLIPQRRDVAVPTVIAISVLCAAWLSEQISAALSEVYGRAFTGIDAFFSGDISQELDSEATRVAIWGEITKSVLEVNPITGLGGGGIYLINRDFGSAHSQYMDILARTGVLGLVVYLYFWFRALDFYRKEDVYIFSGLIAVAVFGLFHETTNSPYVALVFFLLLNIPYQRQLDLWRAPQRAA